MNSRLVKQTAAPAFLLLISSSEKKKKKKFMGSSSVVTKRKGCLWAEESIYSIVYRQERKDTYVRTTLRQVHESKTSDTPYLLWGEAELGTPVGGGDRQA